MIDIAYIVGGLLIILAVAIWQIRDLRQQRQPKYPVAHLHGDGSYQFDVVGERSYQDNLRAICGPRTEDGYDLSKVAVLILEDDNPYDSHAVRVAIDDRTVGYLPRELAREYRQKLRETGNPTAFCSCPAYIRGGWDRGLGDTAYFGVVLDLPPNPLRKPQRSETPAA